MNGMNEVLNRPEVDLLDQQAIDAEFAGIVATMNTVDLRVDSISPLYAPEKSDKFDAKPADADLNSKTDIEGGLSLADQEMLKEGVDSKFGAGHIARLEEQLKEERRMHDFFMHDDQTRKDKTK